MELGPEDVSLLEKYPPLGPSEVNSTVHVYTSLSLASSSPMANMRYPMNRAMARLRWTKLWTAVNRFLL